jgi:hypothetical protein
MFGYEQINLKKRSYVKRGEIMLFKVPGEQNILEKIGLLLRYLIICLFTGLIIIIIIIIYFPS